MEGIITQIILLLNYFSENFGLFGVTNIKTKSFSVPESITQKLNGKKMIN